MNTPASQSPPPGPAFNPAPADRLPSPRKTELAVFFSAARKDSEWRDRIKTALMNRGANLQVRTLFYSDIQVALSENELALVAVIILSPDYLTSGSAFNDLPQLRLLLSRRRSNFRAVAIVVKACDWKAFSEIREIQIWGTDQPIGALPREAQKAKLEQFAEDVFKSLQESGDPVKAIPESPGSPPPQQSSSQAAKENDSPEFPSLSNSKDAQAVMSKARDLMQESGRNLITPSCLIMAIASDPNLPDDSRQFLRDAIDGSTVGFEAALNHFRTDLNTFLEDPVGRVPEAEYISRRTSPRTSSIEPRHLLAALLVSKQSGVAQSVTNRLGRLGLQPSQLRKDFLAFIEKHFAQDNITEWRAILAPEEPGQKTISPLPNDLKFSDATREVFVEALRLMKESGRVQLSVSCLLFGMATEQVTRWSPTARFLRDAIQKAGGPEGYDTAVKAFNKDGDNRARETINAAPPLGPMGRTVAGVIKRAQEFLSTASPGREEIENRHLLAALLVEDKSDTPRAVKARLRKIRIDPSTLRQEFYNFLASRSELDHQDILGQWTLILVPWMPFQRPKRSQDRASPTPPNPPGPSPEESGYIFGTPGYTSEFCGVGASRDVDDCLEMGANADRLAELIALRETKLPLAIGLFGNWGSGKSHFMNLIDQRLRALADEENGKKQGKWCAEIVPIYFNAWHYLDANLWASLVSQIFESLFAHLRPKDDDLKKVQDLLEKASGTAARAAEEVALAKSATQKAREDLETAQKAALEKKTYQDGLLKGLSRLPPKLSEEIKRQTLELLGVEKDVKTIGKLRQVVAESQSLSRRIWNAALKQPGRNWRLGWLVGATVLGPAAIAIFGSLAHSQWPAFAAYARTLVAPLTGVFGFIAWLLPKATQARDGLIKLEEWQEKAEAAQDEMSESPQVKTAELEVAAAEAKRQEAELRLAEAEAREKQLKEEAENLAPECRLGRFIEARAQSADYRGQLGVVSLARRDFQALSDLFADSQALDRKVKAVEMTKGKEAANKLEKLSKSINRIVLFVDDLDRCQPERVVDVLQAVHLLLAFPLFAVVVGVDQRCLRQSLRLQFKGLLTSEPEKKNGEANSKARNDDAEEQPATPLDYLEKIFHVPFHLPPMDEKGFGTMIGRLTSKAETSPNINPRPQIEILPGRKIAPNSDPPAPIKTVTPDPARPSGTIDPPPVPPRKMPPPPLMGSVPLQPWERDALKTYHTLVTTPRAVKRLLNTYRLVRAGVEQDEWDTFKGDTRTSGEFRIVMLLLAAAAGHPAVARQWFESLRSLKDLSSLNNLKQPETDSGWPRFQKLYHESVVGKTPNLTSELFCKWLNRVEIFAF